MNGSDPLESYSNFKFALFVDYKHLKITQISLKVKEKFHQKSKTHKEEEISWNVEANG